MRRRVSAVRNTRDAHLGLLTPSPMDPKVPQAPIVMARHAVIGRDHRTPRPSVGRACHTACDDCEYGAVVHVVVRGPVERLKLCRWLPVRNGPSSRSRDRDGLRGRLWRPDRGPRAGRGRHVRLGTGARHNLQFSIIATACFSPGSGAGRRGPPSAAHSYWRFPRVA
jgi:hypothetical protein